MSRYNRTGLPWGGELGIDVSNCTTSREVMDKAGLNFYVDKCQLFAQMPFNVKGNNAINDNMGDFAYNGNAYRPCPKGYATYRVDKNIPLGIVKEDYTVVQNIEAFNFFDAAIGEGQAIWDKAGCYGYGHRVFVSAKLPIKTDVNGDAITNYLVFATSHDGSFSIDIMFTSIRMFCFNVLNTARQASDAHIRLRHTKSVKDKLDRGREILRIACQQATDIQQVYASLYGIKMSDDAVIEYLMKLNLTDEELYNVLEYDKLRGYDRILNKEHYMLEQVGIGTRKANVISDMFDYYKNGIGQKEIAGNAWGAYNAVTGYYSNVKNFTEPTKRMDSLLYGGANTNMLAAFNMAIDLAEAV